MSKYLDFTGLGRVLSKLTGLLSGKVDKVEGKGLSTNDYDAAAKGLVDKLATADANGGTLMTTEQAAKLAGIEAGANLYQHPAHTSHASGLYKVTVDESGHVSSAVEVVKADITGLGIPAQDTTYNDATNSSAGLMSAEDKAKLDAFGNAEDYALKSDITNVYRYKGSVATVAALPASGNTVGDVYDVQERGINYAWDGTKWDPLGELFALESISNEEIDSLFV